MICEEEKLDGDEMVYEGGAEVGCEAVVCM